MDKEKAVVFVIIPLPIDDDTVLGCKFRAQGSIVLIESFQYVCHL